MEQRYLVVCTFDGDPYRRRDAFGAIGVGLGGNTQREQRRGCEHGLVHDDMVGRRGRRSSDWNLDLRKRQGSGLALGDGDGVCCACGVLCF